MYAPFERKISLFQRMFKPRYRLIGTEYIKIENTYISPFVERNILA
jgi:hypothetical protein